MLAVVLGALAVAALPPFYVFPVLWISLSGLLYLNWSAPSLRSAALEGWFFGLGWFGGGFYWIGHAFLVDAERYAALMPVAVLGMAAGMGLYTALGACVLHAIARRYDKLHLVHIAAFAGTWTLCEWLRSWMLTGFPWNPLASVWGNLPEMMQSVAWIGALGLSLLTAAVFAAPALLIGRPRAALKKPALQVLAICVMLPLLWAGGMWRVDVASLVTHEDIVLRLVQPAIPQKLKWQSDLRRQHVIRQMAMSKRTPGPLGPPTHVIWAETNVPFVLEPDSPIPSSLAAVVPPGGALIFGAPRRDQQGRAFNSLFVIDQDGKVADIFDKYHLVPFGEYVPFRSILPVNKLTEGRGDFSAGPGPRTQHFAGLPSFGAIICYEVIFAGNVVDPNDRPSWILNLTNDGWFGPSTGPRQHLVQAKLRAIEEGLPVVRVANTGISAVIDPYGRVRNSIGLDEQGIIDAPLPLPLAATVFADYGQSTSLLLALLGILVGVFGRRLRVAGVA
ncbi:MAG: apolipoprotein N-acyltransferase [Rhodospirillales bacterium]|nr:apolipoprotein N-acyltransferase [Rhodospirillales bacterium]MBO6787551.1 apolipoprotein N-acyltransferase [Rhodospirillales bacterium]